MNGSPVSHNIPDPVSIMLCPPNVEHARYVYDRQGTDTPSATSDEESWDSDESTSRRLSGSRQVPNPSSRTRMSLLTGQYFDIPLHEHGYRHYEVGAVPGKAAKRRFFQSSACWDESVEQVVLRRQGGSPTGHSCALGDLMERGGKGNEGYEGWDDMAVES